MRAHEAEGRCHIVERRTREFCVPNIFKRPRLPRRRRGPVKCLARWAEIDLDAKVWTIPPARMKAGKEHRVPLSGRAIEIIEKLAETRWSPLVFGCSRTSMAALVPAGPTVHGF